MGSFDLQQPLGEEPENVAKSATTIAGERSWRHWMLGPIAFLLMCGTYFQVGTGHQYIYRRVQGDMFPNKTFTKGISYCVENTSKVGLQSLVQAQKTAADYELVFSVLSGAPAILASIVLGSCTDAYGRKFLMLVSLGGKLVSVVIMSIGTFVHMDLKFFGIAYFIDGIVGTSFTFLLAMFAYVADITTPHNRGIGVMLVEISMGLGGTTASLAAGYTLQAYGFDVPFVLSVCCVVVSLLMTIFILPESLTKDKRKSPKNKFAHLRRSFEFYYASWNRGFRWKYIIVVLVISLTVMSLLGRGSVETLYQLNKPFCWTPSKIGIFSALKKCLLQVVGFIALKTLKRFVEDDSIAIVGSASFFLSYIFEGFATNDAMLYLVPVIGSCGMLTVAMMRSVASRMAGPDRQGAVFASISVAETCCHLVSGILINAVYGATVDTFRGAVFFLMAGLSALSIILLVIFKIGSRNTKNKVTEGEKHQDDIEVISFAQKTKM